MSTPARDSNAAATPPKPASNVAETALAKKDPSHPIPIGDRGVVIKTFSELRSFADLCVANGMAPKGMSAGAAAIAIQAGLEHGLGLMGGLQQLVVINGILSWRGKGAFALIVNSAVCVKGTLKMGCAGEGEEMKGWAEGQRVGYSEPKRVEFSAKDARTAGLWGKDGPWKQYPKRQVQWRAFGFLARDLFEDVLGGFPIEHEVYDHPEMAARVVSRPIERTALPPPADDPLIDVLTGRARAKEPAMIDAEAVPTSNEVEKQEAPDDLEDEPELDHTEADRLLAEQEKLEEERRLKRGGLF